MTERQRETERETERERERERERKREKERKRHLFFNMSQRDPCSKESFLEGKGTAQKEKHHVFGPEIGHLQCTITNE